jgi:hypothetical protein
MTRPRKPHPARHAWPAVASALVALTRAGMRPAVPVAARLRRDGLARFRCIGDPPGLAPAFAILARRRVTWGGLGRPAGVATIADAAHAVAAHATA